jgi:threonine synthase
VVAVEGTREDVAKAAANAARDRSVYHLNHNVSETFVAGNQTLAFELAAELESLPAIVMPVGGGSLVAGCFQGFGALRDRGRLSTVPPLFGVQAEACAPLVQALANGWDKPLPVEPGPTIAGGISIADPPRGTALLRALRETHGGAVAVSDEAIVHWGRLLATLEGVYAEPTSAAAVAGLARLVAAGQIPAAGTAVVVITGSGLKDPEHSGDLRPG